MKNYTDEFRPNLLSKRDKYKLRIAIQNIMKEKYNSPILEELQKIVSKIRVDSF